MYFQIELECLLVLCTLVCWEHAYMLYNNNDDYYNNPHLYLYSTFHI